MKHLVASALIVGLIGCATTPPTPRAGLYSDVQFSSESGDYDGYEAEVHLGPTPTVTFTACEGACSETRAWPATLAGATVSFATSEDWTDSEGRVTPHTERFVGEFKRGALVLTSPDRPGWNDRLPLRVRSRLPVRQ